jgi:NAD(P)-dependent dehydrogenase (short-subunit alcohol dehydrogenase family)
MRLKAALALGGIGVGVGVGAASALLRRHPYSLAGRTVLITGGSRGLGLALALEFARVGCRVAVCARNEQELETARRTIAANGTEVLAVECDVSDPSSVERMVESARLRFGQIDVLVNNAGIISVAPVENTTITDFERAMAVMFWGVLYPTFAVLPEMKARGEGRIATITSIGGKISVPHLLPYSCAKFAAVAFSEGLRAEMARYGVRVTTIAPGLMRTGSHLKAEFKGKHESEAAWFSLSATSPLVAMSATRAARQIVTAIRCGKSEKILSTQASMVARLNAVCPGLMPDLLGAVNRLLPPPTSDRESMLSGEEVTRTGNRWLQTADALGRGPAKQFNQLPLTS